VTSVRRALQKALVEEDAHGLTQSAIARAIGVHRSVINRELRGEKDITLSRVAELAYAMGRKPVLELRERKSKATANHLPVSPGGITTSEIKTFGNVPSATPQQGMALIAA
jgi:transcriptional regulator with XRE-family HTH domain